MVNQNVAIHMGECAARTELFASPEHFLPESEGHMAISTVDESRLTFLIPSGLTSSILIPSFRRAATLEKCLRSIAAQNQPPTEVLVVWQEDDWETRAVAEAWQIRMPCALRALHSAGRGVVPAENTALDAARGEIILLIDDDAVAPPDWVERHLALYADPRVGAVGGPADNLRPDGMPFPRRDAEPVGRLNRLGRAVGNMYDQPPAWRQRPPREVDHLVGYNFSLRRVAFDRFDASLKPYWQMFELDACLQIKARGYRVMFDFANVVTHQPTNTAYTGGREGDLAVKIYNPAFNHAFILARRRPGWWLPVACAYQFLVGSVGSPGLLAAVVAVRRHGCVWRELGVLGRTWRSYLAGLRAGRRARQANAKNGLRYPF